MATDIERAKEILHAGGHTLVMCFGETVYRYNERGVKPLLGMLDAAIDVRGFFAADKVVGGAAAFLYVLLGVRAVHAGVISERALAILAANAIAVTYDTCVPAIKNRTGDGFCPMETATRAFSLTDARGALAAVRRTLARLADGN